jgi:hypothetical protein
LNVGFPDDLLGCKQRVRPALEIIRSNLTLIGTRSFAPQRIPNWALRAGATTRENRGYCRDQGI